MNNLDLTRWLLKVRNALAEQNEAKRNSMLRAANELLRRNNQSLALRGRDPRNLEGARALTNLSSRPHPAGRNRMIEGKLGPQKLL
jgi:hypothetical protein